MRKPLLVALIAVLAASAEAKDDSWSIGPRTLPPPAGASEALRNSLADAPAPAPASAPQPATLDGWKQSFAKYDADLSAEARRMAEKWKLDVQEVRVGGVRCYRVTPPAVAPRHAGRLFVALHPGGFVKGGGWAGLPEALEIAAFLKMPVLAIDYRLAPEHPAPAALDDVIAVWRGVLETQPAGSVVLGGTSAGANLTLAATMKMKTLGLDLPAALMIGTPAADLAGSGDTRYSNAGIDRVVPSWDGEAIALYVGKKKYDDPMISPLYGDFRGLPPSYLISGTRDLLLSDTVRVHRKLRQAGVDAELHVYEGMAHAEYLMLFDSPEMAEHYRELDGFVERRLSDRAAVATAAAPATATAAATAIATGSPAAGAAPSAEKPADTKRGLLGDLEPNKKTKQWRSVGGRPGRQ